MSDSSAERIRQRLVQLTDELRALPADDFASKHRLHSEADQLRRQLSERGRDSDDTLRQWADRAARKATHTVDDDVEAARAAIVSPGEGGGSA